MIHAPKTLTEVMLWHSNNAVALQIAAQEIFDNPKCMPYDLKSGKDKQEMSRFHMAAAELIQKSI